MLKPQFVLDLDDEIAVDLFAGGSGVSTGIEAAIGRHVTVAINHNPKALAMHRINHPQTEHYCEDVWDVDPLEVTGGRRVASLHASPDCTHHSQAKGGQPRSRQLRSLSWVVLKWAGKLQRRGLGPKLITLENVEQILQWGPLVAKRCPQTGRVLTLDQDPVTKAYRVAEPGERVPVDRQFLVPCERRKGEIWSRFVSILRGLGYQVEWRKRIAADSGVPTSRERLIMIARCDGLPIVWPEPICHRNPAKGQKPWRSAAECIDWDVPVPSIFGRDRELVDATKRRIAYGIQKYVLGQGEPFIAPLRGTSSAHRSTHSIRSPLSTISAGGTHHALIAPTLVTMGHGEGSGKTARRGPGTRPITAPVNTITASGGGVAVCAAFLAQMNGGATARPITVPMSTITTTGSQQQLVTVELSEQDEAGALRVAAFLMRYYGTGGQWSDLRDPMATITTRDRMALVTVTIQGRQFAIVDIGLRMLTPRELYTAQGFPPWHIIDKGIDEHGKVIHLTKKEQVHMVGNSVPPPLMEHIYRVNFPGLVRARELVAA